LRWANVGDVCFIAADKSESDAADLDIGTEARDEPMLDVANDDRLDDAATAPAP
jgi:hypothetical protein